MSKFGMPMSATSERRVRHWGRAAAALAGAVLFSGCIDFGFRIYDAAVADGAAGGGDAAVGGDAAGAADGAAGDAAASADAAPVDVANPCVEGPTAPADDGPQLVFATLKVDKPTLTVAVGEIVTWTNSDTQRHNPVAGAPGAELPAARGGFKAPEMATGTRWAYRFCKARTVFWFCGTHPKQMSNYRIVVK